MFSRSNISQRHHKRLRTSRSTQGARARGGIEHLEVRALLSVVPSNWTEHELGVPELSVAANNRSTNDAGAFSDVAAPSAALAVGNASNLLSAGWTARDIGSPAVPGSSDQSGSAWTVRGGGTDIYGTSDQFHYVSQSAAGDVAIIARVSSLTNSGSFAKAGVMIRDGITAGAAYAFLFLTPQGVNFEYRGSSGAATQGSGAIGGIAPPTWVMLTRTGNSFRASYSSDGVNWVAVGVGVAISMSATIQVGLAVDANSNTGLNTATFNDVSVGTYVSTPSRVNLARLQTTLADSFAWGSQASFATDSLVNSGSAWQSSGSGPHWLAAILPTAMQVGSAQLYLGQDDTQPIANFSLQYQVGFNWVDKIGRAHV